MATGSQRRSSRDGRWPNAMRGLLVGLGFAFTAVLAAPLTVQIHNQYEFAFDSADLLRALLPAFGLTLLGLGALLALLRGRPYRHALSVLFVLSLLLWLQGNLLLWDYGALDGRDIDWRAMWPYGVVDGALWLIGLALAVRHADWIGRKLAAIGSVALILVQVAGIYTSLSALESRDRYRVDAKQKFVFSRQTNVVFIVVDAFQADLFQQVIDEEPEYKDVFDGFVFFRNAVSAYRQSYPSVPHMLTGIYYENTEPTSAYLRRAYTGASSLPKFLREAGYLSEVYEHPAGMYFHPAVVNNVRLGPDFAQASSDLLYNIDVTLFRYLPHFLKRLVYNNQLWLLSRWFAPPEAPPPVPSAVEGPTGPRRSHFSEGDLSKLRDLRYVDQLVNRARVGHQQPVFKFYHLLGTHLPIRMDRHFAYVEPVPDRAALKELAIGVIGLLDLILERFRELGIFDSALIVIAADHGIWTDVGNVRVPDHIAELYPEPEPVPGQALPQRKATVLPLILIKRPGARGDMLINDAPVALGDLPKTVVSELGFDAGSFPGESMFALAPDQPRQRRVLFSSFEDNRSYSEPYRSTMTEFQVDGFAWLDSAWRATGRTYPPPE